MSKHVIFQVNWPHTGAGGRGACVLCKSSEAQILLCHSVLHNSHFALCLHWKHKLGKYWFEPISVCWGFTHTCTQAIRVQDLTHAWAKKWANQTTCGIKSISGNIMKFKRLVLTILTSIKDEKNGGGGIIKRTAGHKWKSKKAHFSQLPFEKWMLVGLC